jgi:hypothetical protein
MGKDRFTKGGRGGFRHGAAESGPPGLQKGVDKSRGLLEYVSKWLLTFSRIIHTERGKTMNTAEQVSVEKKEGKKGFLGKFLSFLMYGGFLVVIAVAIAIVVVLDMYVF